MWCPSNGVAGSSPVPSACRAVAVVSNESPSTYGGVFSLTQSAVPKPGRAGTWEGPRQSPRFKPLWRMSPLRVTKRNYSSCREDPFSRSNSGRQIGCCHARFTELRCGDQVVSIARIKTTVGPHPFQDGPQGILEARSLEAEGAIRRPGTPFPVSHQDCKSRPPAMQPSLSQLFACEGEGQRPASQPRRTFAKFWIICRGHRQEWCFAELASR